LTPQVEGLVGSHHAPESEAKEREGRKCLEDERTPYGQLLMDGRVRFVVDATSGLEIIG